MRPPLTLLACALMSPAAWAGGGVHADTQTVTGRQVVLRADAPPVAPVQGGARSLYVLHCAGCHGMDASGSALGRVPDMRRVGDFLRLPGGREFIVKVPGVMGSGLNDAEVAAVTNWVLTTLAPASLPSDHRPYDANEIRHARITPLIDVAAERERLIAQAQRLGLPLGHAP